MASAKPPLENSAVASELEEAAQVLRQDGAGQWHIKAYLAAAKTVREMREPVVGILEHRGRAGLVELPTIGKGIAARIESIAIREREKARSGEQLSMFEAPRSDQAFPDTSRKPKRTDRVVRELFETEAAELRSTGTEPATSRGGSDRPPRSRRSSRPAPPSGGIPQPGSGGERDAAPVETGVFIKSPSPMPPPAGLLLVLDHLFRRRASSGPADDYGDWRPTWEVERDGWRLTLRWSDSEKARRMGRDHDWVHVEWEDLRDTRPVPASDRQTTIVTEYKGPLSGRRVVRGRERECLSWWANETERRLKGARWARG